MTNNYHDLPGACLLTISYCMNMVQPNTILIYVQIFAGLAAGAFYLKRFLKKDK